MQKQGWKYQIIEDTGSGMNYKKPGLLKLIDLLLDRKISYIAITHKDRLLRFGFELIEYIAKKTPWPSATCRNENGGIELNKGLSS